MTAFFIYVIFTLFGDKEKCQYHSSFGTKEGREISLFKICAIPASPFGAKAGIHNYTQTNVDTSFRWYDKDGVKNFEQ